MATRPTFSHTKPAIDTFVNTILDDQTFPQRAQCIMLSGILLNNVELVGYAASIDPTSVTAVIPPRIAKVVTSIICPEKHYDTMTNLRGAEDDNGL